MTTAIATAVFASASLTCTSGGRNAAYHCQIVQVGEEQYCVNFQYGAIGSALRPGSKTKTPVPLAKAQKIFADLVAEKKAKDYRESSDASVTEIATSESAESFQSPQLLVDLTREEAEKLIGDDRFILQVKHDGHRKVVAIVDGSVRISNKLAQASAMETVIIDQIRKLEHEVDGAQLQSVTFDGEHIGDTYYVFDILQLNGMDLRNLPYEEREAIYQGLLAFNKYRGPEDDACPNLVAVASHFLTDTKRAAFDCVETIKGEGLVFKLKESPYTEGRPNSGGPAFKYRFKERSTCICLGDSGNGKRSIRLGMFDTAGAIVFVGKVTVPVNLAVPEPNDLVEVEYAHMFEGGALYHSVMIGVRDDVRREECALTQVKRIKAKTSAVDDE